MDNRKKHVLAALGALAIVGAATTGVLISASAETTVAESAEAASTTQTTSEATTSAETNAAGEDLSSGSITISSTPSASAPENSAETSTAEASSSVATTETATTETTEAAAAVTEYADGTYVATGNYSTPGGSESVEVTVTLTADVVTAVDVTGSATQGNSAEYQEEFIAGYSNEVVGKALDDVNLSRVAGSSLTSTGFNEAIEQVKSDALN